MFGLIALNLVMGSTAPAFSVTWPETLMRQFSGKIYLYISKKSGVEPRMQSDLNSLTTVAVMTVKNAKQDSNLSFGEANTVVSGQGLTSLPPGDYMAQAVIDRNPAAPRSGDSDGNLYSVPVEFSVDTVSKPVILSCEQAIMEPTVQVGRDVKVVEMESTPISSANRRSYIWRAAVVLPDEFTSQPTRKFPVVVDIPDAGQPYSDYAKRGTNKAAYVDGKPVIYVRIDADGPAGYHLFANSPTSGPWATALEQEFLPYIEKEYRGDSSQVSLIGKGGGGWSALWLLANNPDAFEKVQAIDPSAVDFHQLHGLNLYADENAFTDAEGAPRRWQRTGIQTWQGHADIERVLRGLQISEWESDFSPRAKNGKLVPLFDRSTGHIDPNVAKAWQAYDLDAYLKENWPTLGPKLAGKVTIMSSGVEPDFSDEALQMFKSETDSLGAKFSFEQVPAGEIAHS